ncbi:MAG: radical SAM protein [Planctomycetes bacterium]|nr:radical SAM protein [Planctomycetota bacterium]
MGKRGVLKKRAVAVKAGRGETGQRALPYGIFELTLVVTANCTMRCTYCYAGGARRSVMDESLGRQSIDRALRSMSPKGRLELGFFGGEPLLEAELVGAFIDYARRRAAPKDQTVEVSITTNGTATTESAWKVMMDGGVQIAVSCDGTAGTHDRHRKLAGGKGSWKIVEAAIRRLVKEGKDATVVMVLRPDTVADLPAGLAAIRDMGIKFVSPSLDLWTQWRPEDIANLGQAVAKAADLWKPAGGGFGIGWFDDMSSRLAGLESAPCARCAFGAGQIAVSTAGNLYPCERLIGRDADDNPHRLAGHATRGEDFLGYRPVPLRADAACRECTISLACSTYCRCSNLVRTGDVARPDRLLCELNKAVFKEVSRILGLDKNK